MKKSKLNLYINGKNIYLRELQITDVNRNYINWLNDPEINQYLECRFQKWTAKKLKAYVKDTKANKDNFFFAIIRRDCDKHIGNIKLGPVNWRHKYAEIGIIIGDKASWGRGFATEAIKLVKDFAFNKKKLHKLTAGIYDKNFGSIKAFQKAGFCIEGIRKEQYSYKDSYVDCILVGCIRT